MSATMKQSAGQTVGPFFRIGLIYGQAQNNLVNEQTSGERITLTGVVVDGDGEPIPDAMIEIWQPDSRESLTIHLIRCATKPTPTFAALAERKIAMQASTNSRRSNLAFEMECPPMSMFTCSRAGC